MLGKLKRRLQKWLFSDLEEIRVKAEDKDPILSDTLNMGGGRILNVGSPTVVGDALVKGTRLTMAEMPDGASGQVIKGAGPGLNPAYGLVAHGELTGIGANNHHPQLHQGAHADGGTDEITSALDARAYPMLADLIANRPPAGIAGRFFWSTDERILYRDNGTVWEKVAVADHPDLNEVTPDDHHAQLHAGSHGSGQPDAVSLDAAQIATGRFGMARMPDGPGGQVLTGRGIGVEPGYASVRGEVRTTDPVPLEEGMFWYRSDLRKWRVVEGEAFFGKSIRSAPSPATLPRGIGGDGTTIWHCDSGTDRVYELSTVDFSVVRSAAAPATGPMGLGGNSTTIWHCDPIADRIYELSTTDFSIVRNAISPAPAPFGIGGDSSVIWHSDGELDRVYELSVTDFAVVRSASTPATSPVGIGGDSSVIWHSDNVANRIYELSIIDFSVVKAVASPVTGSQGIGGSSDFIWHSDSGADQIHELGTGFRVRTVTTS